ncbi:MAG TPA: nuclear transport factor 2 family protein [Acidimicrobiales bacterium]|nr:nuclear transport factor 2 family protein [Acidimicrobiales bacterium]
MSDPATPERRARRQALLQRLIDSQNRSDIDGVLACFAHPEVELVGANRRFTGSDEVGTYLRDSRSAFPDQRFELIMMHHADDAVICEFWFGGTHRGDIHGFEATGRGFRVRMASFFAFDGDDLVGQRIYYDARSIVMQLA